MAPSANSFDDMPQIEPFPLSASNDVDWNKLGLQSFDLASHIESLYSAETGAWGEPRIVKSPYLQVHGLAPGLNYGQQCYEGLKACRTADNRILVFRPRNHAMRMQHSAQTVSIPPIPESHFLACVNTLVASQTQFVPPHNSNTLLYIRPILFGSSAQLALTPPTEFTFAIFIQPGSAYHGVAGQDALVCENFDRTATHGTGNAKVGGNYAPVMKYTGAAQKEGFGLLLHLDSKTMSEIDEFSTSGFVGVKNDGGEREGKYTLVIPNSKTVIKSVTTDTIAELATSWGWRVERRAVKVDELPFFSEVLAVGTAALLLPIKSITRKSTGQKTVYLENQAAAGPCCQLLRSAIDDIFRGRVEGPAGWCVPVLPFNEVKVGQKQ